MHKEMVKKGEKGEKVQISNCFKTNYSLTLTVFENDSI